MIDSRSSGERNGKSLNRCVCKCCSVYASGLWDLSSDHATGLAHDQSRTERNWKVRPERVIAPYVKKISTMQTNTRVQRDTWNPVGICEDHLVRLNTTQRPIVNKYREGKVKSTPARGVKKTLKPPAYKPWEP